MYQTIFDSMNKINLLCFPFAGGNKYSYNQYKEVAGAELNLITYELPGRGERYLERLLIDTDSIVEDILPRIQHAIKQPYAIYGHSMGTLIGYLVTKAIIANELNPPMHLFLTGSGSPTTREHCRPYHRLPREKFINVVKKLGGIEEELAENKDLLNLYEPILRADFRAVETYLHDPSPMLDRNISVMLGQQDKVTMQQALDWQQVTTGQISVTKFTGGHFFIFNHEKEIVRLIKERCGALQHH